MASFLLQNFIIFLSKRIAPKSTDSDVFKWKYFVYNYKNFKSHSSFEMSCSFAPLESIAHGWPERVQARGQYD